MIRLFFGADLYAYVSKYTIHIMTRTIVPQDSATSSIMSRIRALALVLLIYSTMPFAVLYTCFAVVSTCNHRPFRKQPPTRTALVTGGKMTKSLYVCRVLHNAGLRVVLVEEPKYHCATRYSTAVDRFYNVPPPEDQQAYIRALASIAHRERVGLFVPVSAPKASVVDAMAAQAMPKGCTCWCASPELTAVLDDKAAFSRLCNQLGVDVPPFVQVTSTEELYRLNQHPEAFGGARCVVGGSEGD